VRSSAMGPAAESATARSSSRALIESLKRRAGFMPPALIIAEAR
jgi:hypothetical protein